MMMLQTLNRRFSRNRRRTDVAAVIDLDGKQIPAVVRDISYRGMKLSVPLAIPSGTPISIQTLRQDIPAIVHWYDKGYIGVNLLDRLDSPTLIALESADDVLAKFR